MRFFTVAIPLLLSLGSFPMAQGLFRDQTQKKPKNTGRALAEQTCTINHDLAQSHEELSIHVTAYPEDDMALFDLTIYDPPYAPEGSHITVEAWCIDYDRFISTGDYDMDVFSAFDADIHTDAVDKPQYFPNLVWLLNNVNVGDHYAATDECEGGKITWLEFQGAVWKVIDDRDGSGEDERIECIADGLAARALAEGNNYEPDCSDPNEIVPLVFVVDKGQNGKILNQVLMSETKLSSIDGMCQCEEDPTDRNFEETDAPKEQKTCDLSAPSGSFDCDTCVTCVKEDGIWSVVRSNDASCKNPNDAISWICSGGEKKESVWKGGESFPLVGNTVWIHDGQIIGDDRTYSDSMSEGGGDCGGNAKNANGCTDVCKITCTEDDIPPEEPASPPEPTCLPTLDFEKDGAGNPTSAGDLAADMWADLGISISTGDSRKPAMLFDTAHPTGEDEDLAHDTEGMVLIISEDGDQNDPDDNAGGGTITISFEDPVMFHSLGLLDLEQTGYLTLYDPSGNVIGARTAMPTMGDGEAKRMALDATNVGKMKIEFAGSGALTDIEFCADPSGADSPTKSPTVTTTPTASPVDSVPEDRAGNSDDEPKEKASGSGDPHFKMWTGHKFDYHGECDLVLIDNPSFDNNLGLRLHVRTTRVGYFSYIEQVALQIGNETLEFNNDVENFLINGNKVEKQRRWVETKLSGYVVRRDKKAISVRLEQTAKAKIDFIARKNGFPAVVVDGSTTDIFKGSLGLLGEWSTGKRIARDGFTEMNDPDVTAFALEWQVRDTEPLLFREARFPQFPTTCTPPGKMMKGRLGMSHMKELAEKACAHWKEDKEDCIFDVIATRDVMVAAEGNVASSS